MCCIIVGRTLGSQMAHDSPVLFSFVATPLKKARLCVSSRLSFAVAFLTLSCWSHFVTILK